MEIIDSKDLGTSGGFDIRAHLVFDADGSPLTDGDYSEEAIAAWRNDEWHYVTAVVTASRDGIDLGQASIGGCEYGSFPGVSGWVSPLDGSGSSALNGYGPDLIAEAVAEATAQLDRLTASR